MQNEFEKQVQQKMEELKLVPSEPVWQKVEMQIRKKKDRRRLILWIPFLVLLIGGGLWLGIDYSSNNSSYSKTNKETQKQNQNSLPAQTINKLNESTIESEKPSENRSVPKEVIREEKNIISKSAAVVQDMPTYFQRKFPAKSKSLKEPFEQKTKSPANKDEVVLTETYPPTMITEQPEQQKIALNDSSKTVINTDTSVTNLPDNKINLTTSTPDSTKLDSASVKRPEVKKHATSKWKTNLVVAIGSSGLGRINFYNGQKSALAFYSPNYGSGSVTNGGPFYYGPSEIKEGFSFAVGANVKKSLSKRKSFSTGLQYNYYSNTIRVGSQINQNRTILDFSVSRYYSNQTTVLKPYRNQYHFVSVPAGIDWQLLKNHPLNLYTGLSLNYLVQSNALRFDYNTQAYFHSRDAFNNLQLLFEPSLTYSFTLNKKPLAIGPQLQYGLTRIEKGNGDYHLFSYGVKAQWQLSKK